MSFLNGCCGQEAPGQMFSGEAAARSRGDIAGPLQGGVGLPSLPSPHHHQGGHSRDLTPYLCKEVRVFTAVRTQLENHLWSTWDETLDRCLLLLLRAHRTHTPKQHVYIVKENKDGPGVTYDMTEDVILI